MNLSGVLRQLALSSGFLGALAMLCTLIAHLTDEPEAARGLLLTGLFAIFIALCGAVLVRDIPAKTGPREAIWFVIGFWVITPLMATPAFWSSGISPTLTEALFEAISNLTTTGASLYDLALPDALKLWRSCLQLVGGVWSVATAVVIFAALNQTGAGVQKSHFFTLDRDNIFSHFERVALNVLVVYAAVIFVSVVAMTIANASIVDALTRSIAAVTTSGTLLNDGDPAAFSTVPALFVCFLLYIGATNIVFHIDLIKRGEWKSYSHDPEFISFTIGIILVGLGLCLLRGWFDFRLFAEALSFLSTSGMSVTGIDGVPQRLPQPIPEILAFVGGSALSTAGGIKVARTLLMLNRAGTEFKRLAFSHATAQITFRGRTRSDSIVMGVWVYILAYLGTSVILGLGLTLSDMGFDTSFRAAVGAISNVGSLVQPALSGGDASEGAVMLLSLGAILGRIEVLAIAPLFTTDFWRR